jgi:hypothetical protein
MASGTVTELLKNKDVLIEIDKYKWIESEKAGHDIGFSQASKEWLNRHSDKWIANHANKQAGVARKSKK